MEIDITRSLEWNPAQAVATSGEWELRSSSSHLMGYHDEGGQPLRPCQPDEAPGELCWQSRYVILRQIGQGAQGVVYLGRRDGADGFHVNVALKVFSRHPQWTDEEYGEEMRRVAEQALRISHIQHDNLLMIQNFVAERGGRVMVMEWIDGLDLSRLLCRTNWMHLRQRLTPQEWERLNDVVATEGEDHCRLKPGIAVDVLRGCLAGLAALHNENIVHCDLKPANIMIKRSGTKKIVDVDSSCVLSVASRHVRGTPYYMAPERLRRGPVMLTSDVASLGYVLIEMLTGRRLFKQCRTLQDLMTAKQELASRLSVELPPEVRRNAILTGLVERMVALEPERRFADADEVDLDRMGAANFHRHLVKTDLSTDYARELAWWVSCLAS